jgi:hypothetical protein
MKSSGHPAGKTGVGSLSECVGAARSGAIFNKLSVKNTYVQIFKCTFIFFFFLRENLLIKKNNGVAR